MCLYINNIQTVEPAAVEFEKKIVKSCDLLCQLMGEFENFKRSKKIKELIVALNDVEECDQLYLRSMRNLSQNIMDVRLFWPGGIFTKVWKPASMPVSMSASALVPSL